MQYLYLIKCQDFYKIGIANDVESRLAQLSTGNPFPLEVVVVYEFENAEVVERAIHQRYKNARQRGEWFLLEYRDTIDIHKICLMLGGSAFEYTGSKATEQTIEEAEEVQELLLDDPNIRIEKRYNNGILVGFAIRERNKERRVIKYIGKRANTTEFQEMLDKLSDGNS